MLTIPSSVHFDLCARDPILCLASCLLRPFLLLWIFKLRKGSFAALVHSVHDMSSRAAEVRVTFIRANQTWSAAVINTGARSRGGEWRSICLSPPLPLLGESFFIEINPLPGPGQSSDVLHTADGSTSTHSEGRSTAPILAAMDVR